MKACKYYLTYRCNSKCTYCNIWCRRDYETLSLEETKKRLDELKALGVNYVDFTGGEPMLYDNFIEVIKYAKKIGMLVEFTTNGYEFEKYLDEAIKYIDYPNVSLDTLDRQKYMEIRKIDGVDAAKRVAKRLGEKSKNAKIICVVTEKNIDEIDELLKFAQESKIQIYFSPLFSYFSKIKERYAKTNYDIAKLDTLFFEPQAIISSHFIEFFRNNEFNNEPMCMCNKDVITISPEGKIISPCYYSQTVQLGEISDSLVNVVNSDQFKAEKNKVGKVKACEGCTAIPYLGFSFEYNLNYISLLELFSTEYNRFKVEFLNRDNNGINLNISKLTEGYCVLREMLLSIKRKNTKHLIYGGIKVSDGLIRTSFLRKHVSAVKYFYDNLSTNIWQLDEMLPYKYLEKFSKKIFPYIKRAKIRGKIREKTYTKILSEFSMFYLSWWIVFVAQKYNVTIPESVNISMYETNVRKYLKYLESKVKYNTKMQKDISRDLLRFDLMCNEYKEYVVPNTSESFKIKSISKESIENSVIRLKKNVASVSKLLQELSCYDLQSLDFMIEKIKETFSEQEIYELKEYIKIYRCKDMEVN